MKVLVTRPEPEASVLGERLTDLGYDVFIEPMMDVQWLDASLPDFSDYDGLVVTSANGVRAVQMLTQDRSLPVFAVGSSSAELARKAGFEEVHDAAGDIDDLAALIEQVGPGRGGRLLHPGGAVTAGDLAKMLSREGVSVRKLTLYQTVAREALSADAVSFLKGEGLTFVVLFSPRTARIFRNLTEPVLRDTPLNMMFICLSENVADVVRHAKLGEMAVAESPNTESLLKILAARSN